MSAFDPLWTLSWLLTFAHESSVHLFDIGLRNFGLLTERLHKVAANDKGSGAAIFLDIASVQKHGNVVTFWTKLDDPSWLNRPFGKSEFRTKTQIDCRTKTMRDVAGGVYVNGSLRHPSKKLLSGKIGTKGYGKLLYDRVC